MCCNVFKCVTMCSNAIDGGAYVAIVPAPLTALPLHNYCKIVAQLLRKRLTTTAQVLHKSCTTSAQPIGKCWSSITVIAHNLWRLQKLVTWVKYLGSKSRSDHLWASITVTKTDTLTRLRQYRNEKMPHLFPNWMVVQWLANIWEPFWVLGTIFVGAWYWVVGWHAGGSRQRWEQRDVEVYTTQSPSTTFTTSPDPPSLSSYLSFTYQGTQTHYQSAL